MPSCPLEQAVAAAERVRRRVESPNNPDLHCKMTVSVGVASFPLHADSRESLFEEADKALYRAKDSGRNQVCVA
jgi:diguanylate cyclase (GGDEF)-like protein